MGSSRAVLPVSIVAIVSLASCAEAVAPAAAPRTPEQALDLHSVGVSTTQPIRSAPPEFDDTDPSAVRTFHDVLAPYGQWTDDPRLGLVWIPSRDAVDTSFVPYATHGRWAFRATKDAAGSDVDEYVWLSDLPWGWVTFHYGRWTYTADHGWAWVAGRRYAGAWVDWRIPHDGGVDAVVGWGPTPPSHLWQVSPTRSSRARVFAEDPREARLYATPYVSFATPYAYVRAGDLFAPNLSALLLTGGDALAVAHGTTPGHAPAPSLLGFRRDRVPEPPAMDRGLQQAWMLATPATAAAVGAGPELGPPPRLRTWVAGGPKTRVVVFSSR